MDVAKLKQWSREHRDLAMTVCKAKAFAEVERERVDAYIVPIFLRYAFTDAKTGVALTDPRRLYLSDDDERCKAYYAECDRAHREHGFTGEEGCCPALVAEHLLTKAENLLLDELGRFMGVDGFYSLELRKRALDLALSCALARPEAA